MRTKFDTFERLDNILCASNTIEATFWLLIICSEKLRKIIMSNKHQKVKCLRVIHKISSRTEHVIPGSLLLLFFNLK